MDSSLSHTISKFVPTITKEDNELIIKTLNINRINRKKPILLSTDWKTILGKAKDSNKDYTQYAYLFLLLTGQQIGEALEVKRSDISLKEIDGKNYLCINSINGSHHKNKPGSNRTIPIPLFGPDEETANYLWRSIQTMSPQDYALGRIKRDALAKRFSRIKLRTNAIQYTNPKTGEYEIVEKTISIYPDYLRHARAIELAARATTPEELTNYFGFTSSIMPNLYITLAKISGLKN